MPVVEVFDGDITALDVDAIANAANTQLMHGGGVAGAISRAGGPWYSEESSERAPISLGEAVETSGGSMPCRWVIHAATMELGGPTSAEVIRRATASTLALAERLGARSLALVAFGTGVGGFPLSEAAAIEVAEVRRHVASGSGLERVVFAVRGRCGACSVLGGPERLRVSRGPEPTASWRGRSAHLEAGQPLERLGSRRRPRRLGRSADRVWKNRTTRSTSSGRPSRTASTVPSLQLRTQPATP